MKKILAVVLLLVLCVSVFAACTSKENADLTKAKEYLASLLADKPTVTATDLDYPAKVKGGETFFEVEWTIEGTTEVKVIPSEKSGFVTVDVPAEPAEDIAYKLIATIKDADGNTETLTYEYTVPKFKVFTFQQYVDAAAGEQVVTEGVVTAVISKTNGASYNCLYYQDADGGYYAYNLSFDPVEEGIEVGMTVRVTGTKDIYSGTHEVKDAAVVVMNEEKSEITPVDFTEIFKNAETLADNALVYQQSMLVTIKGIEIGGQNAGNGYYHFKLGDKESYIRISSSVCPLLKEEQTAMISEHAAHLGWIGDVTGVICVYNGNFYLTPVDTNAFVYTGLAEKSDEEMVEFEKGNLSFPSNVSKDTVLDLIANGATYNQVAITWAVEGEGAVIENGKLTLTIPESDSVITLTATITAGEATDTAVFEIKLMAKAPTYEEIVDMAYGLEVGATLDGTYRLFGVITSIDTVWSDQFQNITVTIQVGDKADKLIQCFRLKGDGAADLKVGDAITVEGILKNYNGKIEFDAGCTLVGMGEVLDQSKIVEDAYNLAVGESMTDPATLTGVISSIDTVWSDQFQNITVTIIIDGMTDYPIQCFRLKGEGAADLKVGDTITVNGTLKNYNGTIEFDAGCTLVTKTETPDDGGNEEPPVAPAPVPGVTVLPEATAPFANGDKIVIVATAYNKAFSTLPSTEGGFYQKGVDVTVADGTVTGYAATEIFTVIVNDDGTYSFAYNGQNLGMQESYSSLSLGAVNDKWELVELSNGSYMLKNVVRGNYIEWYSSKDNWSSYNPAAPEADDQYYLSFFVVAE